MVTISAKACEICHRFCFFVNLYVNRILYGLPWQQKWSEKNYIVKIYRLIARDWWAFGMKLRCIVDSMWYELDNAKPYNNIENIMKLLCYEPSMDKTITDCTGCSQMANINTVLEGGDGGVDSWRSQEWLNDLVFKVQTKFRRTSDIAWLAGEVSKWPAYRYC